MSGAQRWRLFGRGRDRTHVAELEKKVSALQSALATCKGVAQRWTGAHLGFTAAVAAGALVLGFGLGVYREPLQRAVGGLGPPAVVTGSVRDAGPAYAAYQGNDYTGALKLARPLADQGDARAQSLLGLLYSNGRGVTRDDPEAARWFHRAAEQGDAAAQFNLGLMYSQGLGVVQDFAEAVKWYQLAADQGYPQAQYNLGLWYATDEGTLDRVSAHKWLNLAAVRFSATDTRSRNAAVQNRDLVASKMTPDQLIEAQKLAREWRSTESATRNLSSR